MNFVSLFILKISPKFKAFLVGTAAVLVGVFALFVRANWPQPLDNSGCGDKPEANETAQVEIAQVTPTPQKVEIAQSDDKNDGDALDASALMEADTPSGKSEGSQSVGKQETVAQSTTPKQVCAPALSPCVSFGSTHEANSLNNDRDLCRTFSMAGSTACLQDFLSCMNPWGTI